MTGQIDVPGILAAIGRADGPFVTPSAGIRQRFDLKASRNAGVKSTVSIRALNIGADGGKETNLALSLNGFPSAFDRTSALLQ